MTPGDSEIRRVGVNVSVLVIVSVAVSVIVARISGQGVSQTVVDLAIGGGAPAGTYLAWEAIRQAIKSGHQGTEVPDDSDVLAATVADQWEEEYRNRRFNDTIHRLMVSWKPADPALMISWERLVWEATHGVSAQKDADPGIWARGMEELADSRLNLAEILDRVPTGWLVVLGRPGFGKSMLMLRLVLDLKSKRDDGGLVPVYVPMTSWNPQEDDLEEWLEKQLTADYTGFAATVPGPEGERSRIAALLAERKIIPILDGLDEMPDAARKLAIERLNAAFESPDRPSRLVVTCRTREYAALVKAPDEPWNPVSGAAAIELERISEVQVADYLSNDGTDHRWDAVVRELADRSVVSQLRPALRNPLYASLASAIYNPHRHHLHGKVPHPGVLCDRTKFPTSNDIRHHLLTEFIPTVYSGEREAEQNRAREESRPPRLLPAERRFMFLAGHLVKRDSPALKWWDLEGVSWLPGAVVGIVSGAAAGLAATLGTHVGVGIGIGFGTGMLIALAVGLGARHARQRWDRAGYDRLYGMRKPSPGMAGGVIGAVIGGLGAGIAGRYHIGHQASLFSGLPEALGIAIGAGATTDFFSGLAGTLIGSFVAGYLAAVGLGVPAGVVDGLGVGMAAWLVIVYLGRQNPSSSRPKWEWQFGIPGGAVIGLVTGFIAWREEGVLPAIGIGLAVAAAVALPFGLRHRDEVLDAAPGPGYAFARDASAFRLSALSAGLAAGTFGFLGGAMTSIFEVGAKPSLAAFLSDGLGIGLAAGVVIGLTFGFYHAASPGFRIVSWWLAFRRKTPWRLRHFLDDAHAKTVLRQSGATYEFRHIILRDHLVARLERENQPSGTP